LSAATQGMIDTVRQIHPEPGDADPAQAYAYPPGRTWLRANMITTLDGAAWHDDRSGALGGAADHRLFALLRGLADAVIVGAGTVRTEGYGPVRPGPGWAGLRAGRPTVPRLAIVTRQIHLDLESPLFTGAGEPPILLTSPQAPAARLRAARRCAEVIVAADLATAIAELASAHPRLLCEGGPGVLAQVATAGLLDELCLTVSPMLTAGDGGRILDGPALPAPARMRLGHVLIEDEFLFLRYTTTKG
jgi:riboflavin biosynthesis pyrimidine reductase